MDGGKRSAWMKHVKATMKAHKGMPLSAVLKMAKKSYHRGGTLMDKMGPMGGARKLRGGQLYGFTGGPYTGSELSDGAGKFPVVPDASYKASNSELLRGGMHPLAPTAEGGRPADIPMGGRRRKTRKVRRSRKY